MPSHQVTITVGAPNSRVEFSTDGINFAPTADLVFTTSNWQTTQTVTMRAVDNLAVDGNTSFALTLSRTTSDLFYASPSSAPIPVLTVTVLDNDVPPQVASVTRGGGSPTNAASVNFTVTFTKPVTGVDASDFAVSETGTLSGCAVTGVAGSGNTYTVTVGTGTGEGLLRLDVLDDDTIVDAGSNPLAGAYSTGEEYQIDRTPPSSSLQPVADATRAGTTTLELAFAASDAVGLGEVRLYVQRPGETGLGDSGTTQAGVSGTFAIADATTDGLYLFASRAIDAAGNAEAEPVTAQAQVLLNVDENSTFSVQLTTTGPQELVLPMRDDLDVTVTLTGADAPGVLSVARLDGLTSPPAYFGVPALLVDEALSIAADFGLAGNATIQWAYDPANAAGLGSNPIDSAWRFDGETNLGTLSASAANGVVTIPGVAGFSTWYIGNASAVPVSVSGFRVE
ncbi:MAG: hypothetical protein N2111_14190 [Candidatus Sumerlaeaceae bacterium]|nr:hypothetical protein [Candidatus Sumerlaeaceae bacterium]